MIKTIIYILIISTSIILAQSPVRLNIYTQSPGSYIPNDFSGISLEMGSLRSGNGGTNGYMFDDTTMWPIPQHKQILNLFRELGIKNIRVGGGSVDMNIVPSNTDIDAFFRFVNEINARVIYSVRLLNGNITDDTNIVKYVWGNYSKYIDCFSIGNEPDWHSYHTVDPQIYETTSGVPGTAYPSYLAKWRSFATSITTAAPNVKFGGPDTGSNYPIPGGTNTSYNGLTWTTNFANDEVKTGIVKSIFFHNYVGQGAPNIGSGISVSKIINMVLSTGWVESYYPLLYAASGATSQNDSLTYRLTESNSFSGYRAGASNSFATALFSLDYMHWWAAHGAAGVNFHNKQWVGNGPIYMDGNGNFQTYPVGYGIAAFNIGGHGRADSLEMTNPDTLNITSYAVADTNALYLTIINKEHNTGMRNALVNIIAPGYSNSASVMYLMVPDSNVLDTTGVLLGGASITNSGWQGKWSSIDSVNANGYYVTVPAASAAIVKIMGNNTGVEVNSGLPAIFTLSQNYPNPFNPSTTISYSIPKSGFVSLKVYNILGQAVATLYQGYQKTGSYKFNFDASGLASGVYLYRIEANGLAQTKKMILMK